MIYSDIDEQDIVKYVQCIQDSCLGFSFGITGGIYEVLDELYENHYMMTIVVNGIKKEVYRNRFIEFERG